MATRWLENIRSTQHLTLFPGGTLNGSWPAVVKNALQEFNKLSGTLGLGVTMTVATAPVDRFLTGANVQVEAATNSATFTDTFLGPQTITFGGSAAKTRLLPSPSRGGRVGQALILLPSSPQVLAGHTGTRTLREAGDPIKLVIAVHELIHACGLEDSDHTPLGNPDIFVSPFADEADPVDPAKDREDAGTKNGVHVLLPPVVLSAQTAAKIKALWSVPNP
jgi:hypothetical protein